MLWRRSNAIIEIIQAGEFTMSGNDHVGRVMPGDLNRQATFQSDVYGIAFIACMNPDQQKNLIQAEEGKGKNYQFLVKGAKTGRVFVFAFTCSFFTVVISFLLYQFYLEKSQQLYSSPATWPVQITRLICTTVFHLSAINRVTSALLNLKFLAMHHNKFSNPNFACCFALLQISVTIFVECMVTVQLIASETHKDCLENFLAMAVIL